MANMAHPLQIVTQCGLLVVPLLAFNLQPAKAQAPPNDPATQTRPADIARGRTEQSSISVTRHPLDPLQPAEIQLAVAAIRKERQFSDTVRFVTVSLKEPSKEAGRQTSPNVGSNRDAFVILLDSSSGRGYEAVVDLNNGAVKRYEALPEGVQPPIMSDEFMECEDAVKRVAEFREAMKKRGIDDVGLIMVDAWSAGHYGNEPPEDRGKRLVARPLLDPLGTPRQRLRPANREYRRGRRSQPQTTRPRGRLRRHSPPPPGR